MQLEAIPTIAFDLDLVGLQWNGGGDISGLDVDATDEAIGGELVVGGVAGPAHAEGVTILIELDRGHGGQRGTLRHDTWGALGRRVGVDAWGRRGQDAGAGGGHRGGILQVVIVAGTRRGFWSRKGPALAS